MKIEKPNWIIHYVAPTVDESQSPDYFYEPYFSSIHTHGLDKYGHRDLCLSIAIPPETACTLLNSLGMRIANEEEIFEDGIRIDILANGMKVKFISFDNDPTLYIILPDKNGKLPDDCDCEEPYSLQEKYAKIISENKDYM